MFVTWQVKRKAPRQAQTKGWASRVLLKSFPTVPNTDLRQVELLPVQSLNDLLLELTCEFSRGNPKMIPLRQAQRGTREERPAHVKVKQIRCLPSANMQAKSKPASKEAHEGFQDFGFAEGSTFGMQGRSFGGQLDVRSPTDV